MAREIRAFAATITAGTLITAPLIIPLAMPPRIVRVVRWRVPAGPSGNLGWALGAAGTRVYPWGPNQWVVADNEFDEWVVDGGLESGAWQLQGYNSGTFDHTVYLQFYLDLVTASGSSAAGQLPLVVTA